tara:strand:+ start:7483 stop:7896 length:414 start_codon:yes stop_codon:yes gene_type:complete
MKAKNKPLQERKEEFVHHYIKTRNATLSAKLTGYSEKTAYSQGSRLLKDVEIKEMINREKEKIKERHLKDEDELIERLKEEALGTTTGANASSRVRALELLMKYYNMLDANQKIELSMKDNWFDSIDLNDEIKNHLN